MLYVADTHALIWFLTDNEKLSVQAREVFESVERGESIIIISSISLMELLFICKKKDKVYEFKQIINQLETSTNYIVYDLDLKVVKTCVDIDKVTEIHDKIIVSTSKVLDASLITNDVNITESGYISIIW